VVDPPAPLPAPARAPRTPPPRPGAVHHRAAGRYSIKALLRRTLKPGRHAATHDRPPGQVVTVHVADQTITIDLDDKDSRTVRRTTAQPVRSIKAAQSRKDSRVS
jgi:hypothetical protein